MYILYIYANSLLVCALPTANVLACVRFLMYLTMPLQGNHAHLEKPKDVFSRKDSATQPPRSPLPTCFLTKL